PSCREAFLARRSAGANRAASIGPNPPLPRDGTDVLLAGCGRASPRVQRGVVKVAVYPGSFDPITFGHLDVLGRAADVFDRVVRGVLVNPRKAPLLGAEERIRVIRAAVAEHCPAASPRIA